MANIKRNRAIKALNDYIWTLNHKCSSVTQINRELILQYCRFMVMAEEISQGSDLDHRGHHTRIGLATWVRRYQGLRRHGSLVGAEVGASQGASLRMRPKPALE